MRSGSLFTVGENHKIYKFTVDQYKNNARENWVLILATLDTVTVYPNVAYWNWGGGMRIMGYVAAG